MHPDIVRILSYLSHPSIAVIGSAVHNPEGAKDIDLLFVGTDEQWKALITRLKVKYNGWDTGTYHIRRANIKVPGVSRNVQIMHNSAVKKVEDHPHQILLPSGEIVHEGQRFEKPPNWKYKVPQRKR